MSELRLDCEFEGGTPFSVTRPNAGVLRLHPDTPFSGTQWFYFCVRIQSESATAGPARIEIQWPEKWSPDNLPPGVDAELAFRMTSHDSFAQASHRTIFVSRDMTTWEKLPTQPADAAGVLAVDLPPVGPEPLYLATQIPYRLSDYQALLAAAEAAEPGVVRQVGTSQHGRPVVVLRFPAGGEGGPSAEAPVVFIQAYQHLTEFSGCHVVDRMVRQLAGNPNHPLRRQASVEIVPALDVDGLAEGVPLLIDPKRGCGDKGEPPRSMETNPNRVWHTGLWPEVEAIRQWIEQGLAEGRAYRLFLDLHNGWYKLDHSGACYTVSCDDEATPERISREKQFADWMLERTDHERPGRYWQHNTGGRTFAAWTAGRCPTAQSHTIEFSRHIWWNRSRQGYEDAGVQHHRQFADQALSALAEYLAGPGKAEH